jgi:hypothetical protein
MIYLIPTLLNKKFLQIEMNFLKPNFIRSLSNLMSINLPKRLLSKLIPFLKKNK